MTRFEKPQPGSSVSVVLDRTEAMTAYMPWVPRISTVSGDVIASEKRDDPLTFRVSTGNTAFPVAVVPLRWVKDMKFSDGSVAGKTETSSNGLFHQEVVKGSRGKRYSVTRQTNGAYSCTCEGFRFRGHCKHVNQVKERLEG